MSEKELVTRLKNKERIAFDFLYCQYAPLLYGLILKIVPEKSLATKILYKSFMEAWRRMESYNPSASSISMWLVKIVVEQCNNVVTQTREIIHEKLRFNTLPQLEGKIESKTKIKNI